MLSLEENFNYDFSELLPVFLYTDKNAITTIGSDMDRAEKKAEKLISVHSITAKPDIKSDKELTPKEKEFLSKKEYNKWVDDAYLLMGKSLFYKPDLDKSRQTFDFILVNFPDSKTVFEARLWLARIDIEEQKYREAEDYLKSLTNNINLPAYLVGPVNATLAHYYIKQEKYTESVDPLKKAIEHTRRKYPRTRYTYLLAQLYSKTGDGNLASKTYGKVIKMNPPYKMTFNAKIYRALSYEAGANSRRDIEKQLNKMLKDDKNIDFQDQIYYAIGNLYYKDGNIPEAIKYYKLSLAAGKGNVKQAARTNLTLADLYYSRPDYLNAQAYYDSAVAVIDKDYPNYELIYAKSVSLTNLVDAINTVRLQDSVLTLSKMKKDDLNALVDNLISQERQREEEQRQKAQELADAGSPGTTSNLKANNNAGSWYFYNPTVKNLGQKEFVRIWGNRKLEDNWRRKNKNTVSFGDASVANNQNPNEEDKNKTPEGSVVTNKKSREYYLQNIPFTDSARTESNKKIAASLYKEGEIYSDELKDYPKATQSFEELLGRYPNYNNRLQVYYKLYTIARIDKDIERVGKYQQKIVNEFPNSNFAKLMTNPDYIKELAAQEQQVQNYYIQTYDLFNQGKYDEVNARAEHAMKEYPDHKLYPKFDYLHTVSAGLKKDTLDFVLDLQAYIARYPNTELSENARLLIDYLKEKQPKVVEQQQQIVAKQLYSPSFSDPHYFIYIVPSDANMNQLIFNIINFNLDNFDKLKLQVKKATAGKNTSLCVVSSFKSGSEAMDYYNAIINSKDVTKDIGDIGIRPAVISETNYKVLSSGGKADEYLLFFKEYYNVQ